MRYRHYQNHPAEIGRQQLTKLAHCRCSARSSPRRGKTTILISHRPRVIERADWIVLLEQGSLKLEGTLEDLRTKPGTHLHFLSP